jgi:tRNA(Ile)-lysidine synthase
MLEKLKKHLHENLPFLENSKLLLAISGGIDSVILAHLLREMNLDFSLAHCNFKLRYEDSDKDAAFVLELAKKINSQIHLKEFDTNTYAVENKISTQMAARDLRYNWFANLMSEFNYDYLLTAHHANDNIETVLINLTRGSSLKGLTGIPEINGNIIRPLLPFTRSEIEKYTIANNISWREDDSNSSKKYFRNKIRHEVIPVLQELNPSLLETFSKHVSFLKLEKKVLEDHYASVKADVTLYEDGVFKIDINKLKQYNDCKVYLFNFLKEYSFTDWTDIELLLDAQSGKLVCSNTHRLIKDRDFLLLKENDLNLQLTKFKIGVKDVKIINPINISFEHVNTVQLSSKNKIYLDADLLEYPLYLRKKEDGDYFFPLGMKGKKKVSKYFKDEKMSLLDKENCWLLCDANDTVVWIVGRRTDGRFAITEKTQKILKIKLK